MNFVNAAVRVVVLVFVFAAGVITFAGPKADIGKKIQSAEETKKESRQDKGIAISTQGFEKDFSPAG